MKKSCREYSRVRYRKDLWPYTGKNSRQGDLIRGRSRENHRAVESYRKSLWNMTMKLLLKPSASPIGTSIGVLLIKIPIRSEESGAKSRGLALQPSQHFTSNLLSSSHKGIFVFYSNFSIVKSIIPSWTELRHWF